MGYTIFCGDGKCRHHYEGRCLKPYECVKEEKKMNKPVFEDEDQVFKFLRDVELLGVRYSGDVVQNAKEKSWIKKSVLEEAREQYLVTQSGLSEVDDDIFWEIRKMKDLYEKAIKEIQNGQT